MDGCKARPVSLLRMRPASAFALPSSCLLLRSDSSITPRRHKRPRRVWAYLADSRRTVADSSLLAWPPQRDSRSAGIHHRHDQLAAAGGGRG